MSLILNALRKLDQQETSPAPNATKPDAHEVPDNPDAVAQTANHALDDSTPVASHVNPATSNDLPLTESDFVLKNRDDSVPVESDPPQTNEEIEEDYNIPATDHMPASTLNAWAESPATQEVPEENAVERVSPVESHSEHSAFDPHEMREIDKQPADLELSNSDVDEFKDPADVAQTNTAFPPAEDQSFEPAVVDEHDARPAQPTHPQQDDALPFYNPVVDAVDLDELEDPADDAEVETPNYSHPDADTLGVEQLNAQQLDVPDAIVASDDDHYFYDDEPEKSFDHVEVPSNDETTWQEFEAGVSATTVDGAEVGVTPTQQPVAEDIEESDPNDAPWVTMPRTEEAPALPAGAIDEGWQQESSETAAERKAAPQEWQEAGAQDTADQYASEQRTIEHIENEIDNCDVLTHAVAHGSDPGAVEADIMAAEAIPYAEGGGIDPQLDAALDEPQDSQSSTVAPTDYERQILERLTNQQYERRFNEVYEETLKLIGDSNQISIVVVAPCSSNVTSHAAAHLAIVVASNQRKHVQLIDGNESRWLSVQFGHESTAGLRAVCTERQSDQYWQPTSLPTMRFLPAGIDNSREFQELTRSHADEFQNGIVNALRSFEVTVIDAGSVDGATVNALAAIADVTLLIAEAGQITASQLLASETHLKSAGARNIACVLSGEYATKV